MSTMRIFIKTPCRLHFSLIDLNGSLNRVDGGIGLTLKNPNFTIEVLDRESLRHRGVGEFAWDLLPENQKVLETDLGQVVFSVECSDCSDPNDLLITVTEIAEKFIKQLLEKGIITETDKFPIKITIWDFLYSHMGLGSKTQMALAIAKAIILILDLADELDIETLTDMVGRGGTSGIGYRSFESGGFILDCGHRFGKDQEKQTFLPSSASNAKPARTILRYNFPQDWHILVVILNVPAGASNLEEVNIFQKHCPIPIEEVQQVSHHILMQLLPGIIEKDLTSFGKAIKSIRQLGFKKIEVSLQHDKVKELIQFLEENSKCASMSSFGPTVFSIFESETEAKLIHEKIKEKFSDLGFTSYLTAANNSGAQIEITPE
jgi:beta-ribofuranosylaminobenzene 5'-phosphate synthase